jgi:hypothetical protein
MLDIGYRIEDAGYWMTGKGIESVRLKQGTA